MKIADVRDRLIGDKRRWRAYRSRAAQLPPGHREAVRALERYLLNTGPGDADGFMRMLEDLADLFEQSVAAGTTVREVVGEDPVDFAETFKRNYGLGWMGKEQRRLTDDIAAAERADGGASS